nr:probable glutathione S-transferase [Ipomoea batatas]
MAEVKVLGRWSSPFSARVEIALKLKGVEYEFIQQDLSNKSPLLLKSNPVHKQIPVLLHNGNPIAESLVIVEYIDDTFAQRSLRESCGSFLGKVHRRKGEELEKVKEEVGELLKVLDNELKKKKFLGGETMGFADIAANFVAVWVGALEEIMEVELGLTEEKFPHLCRWKQDFLNCDVIKETLPSKDKLVAYHFSKVKPAAATASQ